MHAHTHARTRARARRDTHTLSLSHTLSHSHTLTLSHSHTLTLSHSHTLTLSHSHTLTLSHSHTHTLSHTHAGIAGARAHARWEHSAKDAWSYPICDKRCPVLLSATRLPRNRRDMNSHDANCNLMYVVVLMSRKEHDPGRYQSLSGPNSSTTGQLRRVQALCCPLPAFNVLIDRFLCRNSWRAVAQTNRQRDRKTDRETDREKERKRESERNREKERERERERECEPSNSCRTAWSTSCCTPATSRTGAFGETFVIVQG